MAELFNAGFERYEAGPGIGLLKTLGVRIEDGIFTFENEDEITEKITIRVNLIGKISSEK